MVVPTTLDFDEAPGDGVDILIFRNTPTDQVPNTFYPGSAIRARDLNDNFTSNLYVLQEADSAGSNAEDAALEAKQAAEAAQASAEAAADDAADAATDAAAAAATANTANATANTALSTANDAAADATTAISTAQAAADAVSDVVEYEIVDDVLSIPVDPSDGDRIEVVNSIGIEDFTPLEGLPEGFEGDSGLKVRLSYSLADVAWRFVGYVPSDPDTRYAFSALGDGSAESFSVTYNNETRPILLGTGDNNTDATKSVVIPSSADYPKVTGSSGELYAPGGFSGNLTGDVTGNVTGDLNGNASGLLITTTGIGPNTWRPICAFGGQADPTNVVSGQMKHAGSLTPILRGDGRVQFKENVSVLGNVDCSGTVSGTLVNSEVRAAIALGSAGNVGTYALLKKVNNGSKGAGETVSGSNLRYASAAGNSQGTPNGTWMAMGRALDDNLDGEKFTTVWLRVE